MTRTWTVCRQYSPRQDGERRWDQAYQLLARQAGQGGLPGLTLIAEEDADARGVVCAGLDYQRNIGMKSRSPQTQRPTPPGQAQLHPPHTAELAICD